MSGSHAYLEEETEALLADYKMSGPEVASTSYNSRVGSNGETLKGRRVSSDEELLDSVITRDVGLERTMGFANIDHDTARFHGMLLLC